MPSPPTSGLLAKTRKTGAVDPGNTAQYKGRGPANTPVRPRAAILPGSSEDDIQRRWRPLNGRSDRNLPFPLCVMLDNHREGRPSLEF